ncbi:hypothetical protein [Neisseria bergeri]|nr:hypothetical protein [Neisseria bergeri]
MTKGCGQQGNDEVSDGIGGFVGLQTALVALSGFRRHCSPAVIPAKAGI